MSDSAERISPLEVLAHPGTYDANPTTPGVELAERLPISLVQIQAWSETGKACFDAISKLGSSADTIIMPTGPDRWLVEADNPNLETDLRGLIDAAKGAVTGLTHARVVVTISGEKAEWVLSSGVPLDFHIGAFAVGEIQVSHHHEIGLTVHRIGEQEFDLYVFTSYARSFWQWITTSSAEVGYRVS